MEIDATDAEARELLALVKGSDLASDFFCARRVVEAARCVLDSPTDPGALAGLRGAVEVYDLRRTSN